MKCMTAAARDDKAVLPTTDDEDENQSPKAKKIVVLDQDLNCLPYPDTPSQSSDDQRVNQSSPSSGKQTNTSPCNLLPLMHIT